MKHHEEKVHELEKLKEISEIPVKPRR